MSVQRNGIVVQFVSMEQIIIDIEKLRQKVTVLRNNRSTVRTGPRDEFIAEVTWCDFSEIAYGPSPEVALSKSIKFLSDEIQGVADKLPEIAR